MTNNAMTIEHFPLTVAAYHRNHREAELVEFALRQGEGRLASTGAFAVETGQHTGRSAQDKYLVRDAETEAGVVGEHALDDDRAVRPPS